MRKGIGSGKWEVGKWGSGEVGKWEVGKWGSGEVGKWGSGEV
ncbi:MAG: molecular chaperone DnaK, partial [Microcystis sp. M040S2]|nr:molecular chaperone DnaK [Microcystis sp. M040S2]MCA2830828.1 molecular chaperone DnaK [Microcystis sp. M086S1]MCA2858993.1 molecular chaperone DnaK [Microcystis sp. M005S1]MCA2935550.1 molecular chaperone DnaK [Microcystis sp. M015S1]